MIGEGISYGKGVSPGIMYWQSNNVVTDVSVLYRRPT